MLEWSKVQPWWRLVLPLLEAGCEVFVHVPEAPPAEVCGSDGIARFSMSNGGGLVVRPCHVGAWHFTLVAPREAREWMGHEIMKRTALQAHGVTGEA